jgi:hypothetical protein
MPEHPNPDVAVQCDDFQRDVLYLMANPNHFLPIWSVEDIGRKLGDPIGAADAVSALSDSGLVYKTSDGYVFATHAAIRMVEIGVAPV